MMDKILRRLEAVAGDVGFYYCPIGGEPVAYNADMPLIAASVIKIPVMIEVFRQIEAGLLRSDARYEVRAEHKMPSCGALTYMDDGLKVTLMDLVTLMIILSDNTATNMLIDIVGIPNVNRTLGECGAKGTALRRKLFDAAASARGIQNSITARDIGMLLEKMHAGQLVSPAASAKMLSILKNQRLNGKIPFFLSCEVAHKTGEDGGTTHDAGIVFAPRPFVLCMFSNNVDVPKFERLIQDVALELHDINGGVGND